MSSTKRCCMEVLVAGHILQASLVWSIPLAPKCNSDVCASMILYIKLFTLDPVGTIWQMSDGIHKASWSPNLEKSQLSVIGSCQTIHTCGTSSISLPSRVFPLGQWWHTLPAQPTKLYKGGTLHGSNEHPLHWFFMRYEGIGLGCHLVPVKCY